MNKVRVLVVLLSLLPIMASAQSRSGAAAAGALEGLGRGLEDVGRQMQQHQHQMEQDRRNFEYQQQLQARQAEIDRQRALEQKRATEQVRLEREALAEERSRIEAERLRLEDERALAQVEQAHPGFIKVVRSPQFERWKEMQPASVQALSASPRAEDAILMLDLYKRDTATAAQRSSTKKATSQ